MRTSDALTLGLYAAVAYGLYRVFGKGGPASQATQAVAGAIASPIAAVSNWYYGSSTVTPSGNVILPSGAKVPTAQLNISWDASNNVASFVYQGYGYIIAPNPSGGPAYDQNGDYHAQ